MLDEGKGNIKFNKTAKADVDSEEEKKEVVHEFKEAKKQGGNKALFFLGIVLVVGLGVLTGYFIVSRGAEGTVLLEGGKKSTKVKKTVGSADKKIFKDSAEGKLEKGGIDGEGSHKLIRPGGDSQTVYLTSSVIDLDEYAGKKVKVWGETFAAEKAGWLMDVGRLEVL